jgi:hypothetical protein
MTNNETTDLVFKQLDMITESIHHTAKEWGITSIPVNTIEMTVTKGKVDTQKGLSRKERRKGNVGQFFDEYNKLLDALINQCKDAALEMDSNKIPLELFDSYIDVIKSSFIAGANKVQ